MVYRLVRLPLSVADFKSEYEHIIRVADVNGFDKSLVDKLVHKHSNKIKKQQHSTLFEQNRNIATDEERQRFVSFCYAPTITNHLDKPFKRANMKLVYSNNYKLSTALGCTKDTVPINCRSGIYQISCSDCEFKYIGQTRRALQTRITEHMRSIKNKDVQKAIPAHVYNTNHSSKHNINSLDNVKLIKHINDPKKLDAYESIFITKEKHLMNLEKGPIESPLFDLL